MKQMHFIGIDDWDRPVYRDDTGQLWKDVNLGSGKPYLHDSVDNTFDGEPNSPIKEQFEIIK